MNTIYISALMLLMIMVGEIRVNNAANIVQRLYTSIDNTQKTETLVKTLMVKTPSQCGIECTHMREGCKTFNVETTEGSHEKLCQLNGPSISQDPPVPMEGMKHYHIVFPCENGGIQWDDSCECVGGYGGDFCENNDTVVACENGGTQVNDTCECVLGYYGEFCENVVTGCTEAHSIWSTPRRKTVTAWYPGLSAPFQTRCDNNANKILEFWDASDNSFVSPWQDYKAGFLNDPDTSWANYFIGLDKLHMITNARPYTLRLILLARSNRGNPSNEYHFHYDSIHVASEQEQYKLTLGSMTDVNCYGDCNTDTDFDSIKNNAYDPLQGMSGMHFSTYDMDNDASPNSNCSVDMGRGGWWYNDCAPCNDNATDIQPFFGNIHRLCLPQMMFMTCPHLYCKSVIVLLYIYE